MDRIPKLKGITGPKPKPHPRSKARVETLLRRIAINGKKDEIRLQAIEWLLVLEDRITLSELMAVRGRSTETGSEPSKSLESLVKTEETGDELDAETA
jgi:hypothetical protein